MDKGSKKCILLKGNGTQYGALNCFTEQIETGLRKLNYEPKVIMLNIGCLNELFEMITKHDYEFVFSFNCGFLNALLKINEYGETVCDFKTPSVSCMVDAPFYYFEDSSGMSYIDKLYGNLYFSFADLEHCEMFEKLSDNPCSFIPQGGFLSSVPSKTFFERNTDVFFAGTYTDFNKEYNELKEKLKAEHFIFFNDILDLMLSNPSVLYFQAVKEVCSSYGVPFDFIRNFDACCGFKKVDLIVRNLRRVEILKAIAENGIALTCYGSKWNGSILSQYNNVTIMPDIDFYKYIDKMTDSKMTLNVLPNYANGAHERIFSAMRNGSISVTDKTPYLKSIFTHGEDVLFYAHDEPDLLVDNIRKALADEEAFIHITESAKIIAERDHTWDNRTKDVLELLKKPNKNFKNS